MHPRLLPTSPIILVEFAAFCTTELQGSGGYVDILSGNPQAVQTCFDRAEYVGESLGCIKDTLLELSAGSQPLDITNTDMFACSKL